MKRNNNSEIMYKLKNDNRKISVDISCIVYNHGMYLRQALDSMLMQETTFPVRIIIHDDASTDNSADIIKEYVNKYPDKIVAILEEKNLYQNGKSIWEKMLPYFTGKYTAYCEGDDYWIDKKKLQKQVDYLENNRDCIACYHNILPVDKNGNYDEKLRGMYELLQEGDYSKREIRNGSLKTQTASLVKRNYNPWLTDDDKTTYINTKCNGDEKQLIVCGAYGRIHYLSDVMAAHRRVVDEGESWTAKNNKKTDVERFIHGMKRYRQLCLLYDHFHKKKAYPYNHIIEEKTIFYLQAKRMNKVISHEERKKMKEEIYIPQYAYIVFVPYAIFRCIRGIIRKNVH